MKILVTGGAGGVGSAVIRHLIHNTGYSVVNVDALTDAGWGEFLRRLAYKADWAGRQLVSVSQWLPSSKACHECRHGIERLPLSQRQPLTATSTRPGIFTPPDWRG